MIEENCAKWGSLSSIMNGINLYVWVINGSTLCPRFMTVSEVADIMRVSEDDCLSRLIHSGEMPAIRVGKSFEFPSLRSAS